MLSTKYRSYLLKRAAQVDGLKLNCAKHYYANCFFLLAWRFAGSRLCNSDKIGRTEWMQTVLIYSRQFWKQVQNLDLRCSINCYCCLWACEQWFHLCPLWFRVLMAIKEEVRIGNAVNVSQNVDSLSLEKILATTNTKSLPFKRTTNFGCVRIQFWGATVRLRFSMFCTSAASLNRNGRRFASTSKSIFDILHVPIRRTGWFPSSLVALIARDTTRCSTIASASSLTPGRSRGLGSGFNASSTTVSQNQWNAKRAHETKTTG